MDHNFVKKMFTSYTKNIKKTSTNFTYNGEKIKKIEFIGVILEEREKYMKILDCMGILIIFKNKNIKKVRGPCSFICNAFGESENVLFYCTDIRKVTIYEELYFWFEISLLHKKIIN